MKTITMFRPTGQKEIDLVIASGMKRWPPRLPEQPIFYPVTNELYATEITQQWNIPEQGIGYVTKFEVAESFASQFSIECVGASHHTEWWIPAERLDELNHCIVGDIEIIATYK